MLSIKKVAELLGVTTQTVRNLVKRGGLPAYRVGSQLRFRQLDVVEYLKKNEIAHEDRKELKHATTTN